MTQPQQDDALATLSGLDMSVCITAGSFAAAGATNEEAITRALDLFHAYRSVRESYDRKRSESTVRLSLEDLREEFRLSDHRQINRYVSALWPDRALEIWTQALSGAPCFTEAQATEIRSYRASLFAARAKRRRGGPEHSEAMCAPDSAVCATPVQYVRAPGAGAAVCRESEAAARQRQKMP
jgi:hypothetical protein